MVLGAVSCGFGRFQDQFQAALFGSFEMSFRGQVPRSFPGGIQAFWFVRGLCSGVGSSIVFRRQFSATKSQFSVVLVVVKRGAGGCFAAFR